MSHAVYTQSESPIEKLIVICLAFLFGLLYASGLNRKQIDEVCVIIQDNIENARKA